MEFILKTVNVIIRIRSKLKYKATPVPYFRKVLPSKNPVYADYYYIEGRLLTDCI